MIILSTTSQIGSIAQVLAMLVIFSLILAAAYYVTRYFGKTMTGSRTNGRIQILDTVRLAPDKYLQIVEAGGRCFLLAISKGSISLISELDKKEIEALKVEENLPGPSFKEILKKVINK